METSKADIREFRADLAALKKASESLDWLLETRGRDVEEVVAAEFNAARKKAAQRGDRRPRPHEQ
jgi:hypothetical protein